MKVPGTMIRAVFLFLAAAAASAQSVTSFTSLPAYTAATGNTTFIGFGDILPQGTQYEGFNPLYVSGVSFSTPTTMNINAADYYSPADYPGDYLLSTSQANGGDSLVITLPAPTLALALDYAELFGGHPGSITLSNGFTYNVSPPKVGTSAFAGFVSTTPITSLTYTVTGNEYWILEDLRISTPVSTGGTPAPAVTLSFNNPIVPAGENATLTWSATNAGSCTASGNWSGSMAPGGSLQITSPSAPGYYPYNLVCVGAGGPGLQSVVLTVSGATPSQPGGADDFTQATIFVGPPNQFTRLQTTLLVPPAPPVPSIVDASLFAWPGLDPATDSVNFMPINNGVLQPVLSWGPSCAPASQPAPFTSWWISGQYVNTFGSDPGYSGCYSGSSLLASPGNSLAIDMALDAASNIWTQTITDSTTNQTVSFSMNMQGQGQNWLYFAIEAYYGTQIYTPAVFSNTTITYQSADHSGWCSQSQGTSNNYILTPPMSQNNGTQCFISSIVLTQPVRPARLSVASSHEGSFTQGQEGASYTLTVSNASGTGETDGTVTVTETVPAGWRLDSMSGTGWNCSGNTCTRSDALSSGSSYPAITVTVNVGLAGALTASNQVSVMGGGSSASGYTDPTTITSGACSVQTNAANAAGDVQAMVNQALGSSAPANDLNGDKRVSVVDVQIVIAAALGWGCSTP